MSRPPSRNNFARETIGDHAWQKMVIWRGGTEYDVPGSLECPNGVELATRIGADAARKLIEWARGSRIYVAAGHAETLLARYQDIIDKHNTGMTPREIALETEFVGRYTERTVRMVLSRRFEEFRQQFGTQEDLF